MTDRPRTAADQFGRFKAGEDPLVALQGFLDGWKGATPQDRPNLLSDAIPDAGGDEGNKRWALLWAMATVKLGSREKIGAPAWASDILDEFDTEFERWLEARPQPAPDATDMPPVPAFIPDLQRTLKSASALLERLERMEEAPSEIDAIEHEFVSRVKKLSLRAAHSTKELEGLVVKQGRTAARNVEHRQNEHRWQRGWLMILKTARDERLGNAESSHSISAEIASQERYLDLLEAGDAPLEKTDSFLTELTRRRWHSAASDLDAAVRWRRLHGIQSGLFRLLQIGPSFALLGIYIDHTASEGLHIEEGAALLASVLWWLGGEVLRRPVESWLAHQRKETLRRSIASLTAIRVNVIVDEAAAKGLRS